MKVHHIPFQETGYFSSLIGDYLSKNPKLNDFYGFYPNLEGFKNQIKLKQESFSIESRKTLVKALGEQYNKFNVSELTSVNVNKLANENTFTVTTGHQLNIFTGPLYFLYKIVSTINLTKQLNAAFPKFNFVPIYWMATEDHDFEEINYFNFKGKKVVWERESSGAVGRLKTEGFDKIFSSFSNQLENTDNANFIKKLFKSSLTK